MKYLTDKQWDYLARLGEKPFMFGEAGCGKTSMSLQWAANHHAQKLLVITPVSVRDAKQWEQEAEDFGFKFDEMRVEGYIFLQRLNKANPADFCDWYVIIDESQRVKNSQSLQGKGAYMLCNACRGFLLLSGTPMSDWAGAVNYAKITRLVSNKTQFYRRYVIEQPSYSHKGKDIVGYRNTDELRKWWNSIALRGRTSEFVDLPRKQSVKVRLPFNASETKYMLRNRVTRDGDILDNAPKLNWALRRVAESSPEKIAWAVDKIESTGNCLVFANTLASIEALHQALNKAGIKHGLYYGARKDDYNKFDVMIMQYQSGGTGLNLQKFHNTIFLSPCYSFQDFSQAIARTHRTGQTERCLFYELESANSIDGAIYKALRAKKDFDDRLVNIEGTA